MEWDARVRAAIVRLQGSFTPSSKKRAFGLIDRFAAGGSISRQEMLAYGSPNFVQVVLGRVTSAVHGGGRVPKQGGWYRIRPGQPYIIDPSFAAAWIRARQTTK